MRWFWKRSGRYRDTEAALGYRFQDSGLLETALTHRSHGYEQGKERRETYERLEFLGDALLGLLVAEWLYHQDPGAEEGQLSRRRQAVVRTTTIAEAARQIGLGRAVLLGRGEERSGGRDKRSLLADTFEAVLGAVYLDGGMRAARRFVEEHLAQSLKGTVDSSVSIDDYKTRLQESTQAKLRRTPRYRIVGTDGPAHAREFEAQVLLGERVLGSGRGTNRKRAEQEAARQALREIQSTNDEADEDA